MVYIGLYRSVLGLGCLSWNSSKSKRKFPATIRFPNIVVGGLKFYRDSSSIFLLFSSAPSELPEHNSTKTGHIHMPESECDLKMYVRNLESPPLQIGAPKPPFWRFCNLKATAYVFGKNIFPIYTIGQMRWKLQMVSYIVSKCHELWSTKGLKLDRHF